VNAAPAACLVLPCFNEEARIDASLATLDEWFGGRVDVLVVDDGSADGTFERAARYAEGRPHVRVVRLPRHRGKGGAIRAAIPLIRADRVLFTDADLAFDRESVERAIGALAAADVAVGNRRHRDSQYSVPVRLFGFLYRRHLVGLMFNALVRALTGLPFRDTQCGLKAFRRACLARMAPALSIDGFALDVEMLIVARALGARLVEVPVNVRYETARSSVTLVRTGWEAAGDLLKIAMRRLRGGYAPGRVRSVEPGAVEKPDA
jgi:glycosyltransferase involved in cell wall biosynthesis